MFVAVVVGILAAIALILWYALSRPRARRAHLAAFAEAHGLHYLPWLPGEKRVRFSLRKLDYQSTEAERFLGPFSECLFFTSGSWRGVENILTGQIDGRDWLIFDYHCWAEGGGESQRSQATCVVAWSEIPLGRVSIAPVIPLVGRIERMVAPSGLMTTGDAEFDQRFLVRADGVFDGSEPLSEAVREYLLTHHQGPRWWLRKVFLHDSAAIVAQSYSARDHHLLEMMDLLRGLLDRIESG